MIIKILKRDGRIEFFNKQKIADAIFKAAQALRPARTGSSRRSLRSWS